MAWHDRISQVEMRRWEKEERRNPPLTFGAIWPAQNGAHCRPIIREYLPSRPTFQYLKKVLRREGPSKLEVTQEDNHSSGVAMVVTKFLVRSGWPLGGSAFLRKSGINIFRNIFFYSQICIHYPHLYINRYLTTFKLQYLISFLNGLQFLWIECNKIGIEYISIYNYM